MKQFLSILVLIFVIFVFAKVQAEEFEEATIYITPPSNLALTICPAPKWKDQKVVWDGVVDNRNSKYVGMQDQKNKPDIMVKSDPELDKIFSEQLFKIFTTCGLKLVSSGFSDTPHIGIEIGEFYAGAKKNIFTGQSTAKSEISIVQRKGENSSKITINVEFESKGLRSKKLSKLEKAINDLFVETLKKIIEQEAINGLL